MFLRLNQVSVRPHKQQANKEKDLFNLIDSCVCEFETNNLIVALFLIFFLFAGEFQQLAEYHYRFSHGQRIPGLTETDPEGYFLPYQPVFLTVLNFGRIGFFDRTAGLVLFYIVLSVVGFISLIESLALGIHQKLCVLLLKKFHFG